MHNTSTGRDIGRIENGAVFVQSEVGIRLSVRAEAALDADKVVFDLNDVANYKTDPSVPFTLKGDNGSTGEYNWVPELRFVGVFTVQATVSGGSSSGASASVTFEIVQQLKDDSLTITDFIMHDTANDIGRIAPSMIFSQSEYGTELSLRAEASPDTKSIVFGLDNVVKYNTESTAPYVLNGNTDTAYIAVPEFREIGVYTVIATAYSERGGKGTAGTPASITFEITL